MYTCHGASKKHDRWMTTDKVIPMWCFDLLLPQKWSSATFSGKSRIHGKEIIPASRPFPVLQMN